MTSTTGDQPSQDHHTSTVAGRLAAATRSIAAGRALDEVLLEVVDAFCAAPINGHASMLRFDEVPPDPSASMASDGVSWVGEWPQRAHSVWTRPVIAPDGRIAALLVVRADGRARPSTAEQQLLDEAVSVAALAFGLHDYHETLRRAAFMDPLTGVGNRARLQHFVSEFATDAQRIAGVLYLDLDDFKLVNDQYGHQVGDTVLEQVAARLAGGLRRDDELIRVGGDEFVVICREPAHPSDLLEIADDLVRRLHEPYVAIPNDVEPVVVHGLTASVGAAHADSISTGPDRLGRLITLADRSMYSAKRRRRATAAPLDRAPRPQHHIEQDTGHNSGQDIDQTPGSPS